MAEARTTPSGARLRPRRGLLRALVLATLLLLAAAVLGSQRDPDVDVPALAEAAISPDGSLIAFTARSGDDLDLFVVDALGRRPPRRLAGGDLFEQGPVFSPDGRRLLFLRTGAFEWGIAEGELWSVGADGSGARRLLPAATDPQWSPDGRRVAAVASGHESDGVQLGGRLVVVSADGTGRRRLAPSRRALSPRWSPDGQRIAFWSGRPARGDELLDRGDVYVVPSSGGPPTRLTSTANVAEHGFAWAPEGKRLAIVRDPDLALSVLDTIDRGGRRLERLPGDDVLLLSPSWSPDGSRIAISASGEPVVWDAGLRRVIDDEGAGGPLLWSADGRLVAHDTTHGVFDPIDADVVVARADGSSTVNVTRTPNVNDVLVGWLGRTRRLAVIRDARELLIVSLHGHARHLPTTPGRPGGQAAGEAARGA